MDILKKAQMLSDAGKYDACGPQTCSVNLQNNLGGVISTKAEHKNCKMFKTLMNNSCHFDCNYCVNRAGCQRIKAKYEPEELARLMNNLESKHGVNGLFLSSGVAGNADKATHEMIEAVKILRNKYFFNGYIHFKVLPGTSKSLIQEAAEYSDRMSINIEAPTQSSLGELSSSKTLRTDALRRQAWIKQQGLLAGQSTQMILSEHSTDKEVLRMMKWEYEKMGLKRMYYSAFSPVKNTPFENKVPEKRYREKQLYKVDFLARDYGYSFKEFYSIMDSGMLPNEDPKIALAKEYFSDGRVDVAESNYEELIRVPGIGPRTAQHLMNKKVSSIKELRNLMGSRMLHAMPFLSVKGERQKMLSSF